MCSQFECEGEPKTFFLEQRILTICTICEGFVALGLADSVAAFDIRRSAIVSRIQLHSESYIQ